MLKYQQKTGVEAKEKIVISFSRYIIIIIEYQRIENNKWQRTMRIIRFDLL